MIEIDNRIIDPEELLERVRRNVLNKVLPEKLDIDKRIDTRINVSKESMELLEREMNNFHKEIKKLEEQWVIQEPEIVSYRKNFASFRILVKKIVKKCVFWIIKPYWEQQIQFNGNVTKSFQDIEKIQEYIMQQMKENNSN